MTLHPGPTTGPEDMDRISTLWFALLLTLANGFLDAHTYLARGGVFANVQTANVIFGAIDTSERKFVLAPLAEIAPELSHPAWPKGLTVSEALERSQDSSEVRPFTP